MKSPTQPSRGRQALQLRITRALENRDVVRRALTALRRDLPPGRSRHRISQLRRKLRTLGEQLPPRLDPTERELAQLLLRIDHQDSVAAFSALVRETEQRHRANIYIHRGLWYIQGMALAIILIAALFGRFAAHMFVSIFDDFGTQLPVVTENFLAVSTFLGRYLVLIPLIVLVIAMAMSWAAGRGLFSASRWMPRGRIIGYAARTKVMSQFAHSTAELLDAGIPKFEAAAIAGYLSDIEHRPELRQLQSPQSSESPQDEAVAGRASLQSNAITHVLNSSAPTTAIADLLRTLGDAHETSYVARSKLLLAFIQPLAVIILGLFVLFGAFALFAPLVSLISNLS